MADALSDAKLYIDIIFRGVNKQTKQLSKIIQQVLKTTAQNNIDKKLTPNNSIKLLRAYKKTLTDIAKLSTETTFGFNDMFKKKPSELHPVVRAYKEELGKLSKALIKEGIDVPYEQQQYMLKSLGKYTFYDLRNEARDLLRIQRDFGKNSEKWKDQYEHVKKLGKELDYNKTRLKRLIKSQKQFNFNFLTFLFAGMMLKRVFGNALKSIIDNYKKITGLNSAFTKSTMKLGASWSYVKFAIGNALNSPFVVNAIEWLSDMLETLGNWLGEHPDMIKFLLAFAGAMLTLGEISMAIGSIEQLTMMFDAMSDFFTVAGLSGLKNLNGLFKTLLLFSAGVGFTWAGFELLTKYNSEDSFVKDLIGSVMTGLGLTVMWNSLVGSKAFSYMIEKGVIKANVGTINLGFMIAITFAFKKFSDYIKDLTQNKFKKGLGDAFQTAIGVGVAVGIATKNPLAGLAAFTITISVLGLIDFTWAWLKSSNRGLKLKDNAPIKDLIDQTATPFTTEIPGLENINFTNDQLQKMSNYTYGIEHNADLIKDWNFTIPSIDNLKTNLQTDLNPTINDTSSKLANVNTELTKFTNYIDNSDDLYTKEEKRWEELSKKVSKLKDTLSSLNGTNVTYTTTHIIKTITEGSNSTATK